MSQNKQNKNRRVIKTNSIDFYKVFSIDKKATKKEIILKYRELVKKYHPDKNPSHVKLFELIQRAWECLGNDERRKKYDTMIENETKIKQNDFLNMRENFMKYEELVKNEITPEKKTLAQNEYEKLKLELDEKIGYDRILEKQKLSTHDSNAILDDYMTLRTQNEIEYSQSPMFKDGQKFDHQTFNAIFDKWKNKNKTDTDIVKKEKGPSPFNDIVQGNFTSIGNFSDPFGDQADKNTEDYSSLDNPELFNEKSAVVDVTPEELEKIRDNMKSNYNTHSKDKFSNTTIENLFSQRQRETKELEKMPFDNFVNDPEKAFLFTHEFEGLAGNLTFDDNDNEELNEACIKLIELEKNNQ